jgi:peptidoglycan/xylan/chitin deacetylase (PgdA/CDA1 family)
MVAWRPHLARALDLPGVGVALQRVRAWEGVIALAYHRIGDGTASFFDQGLWSATVEDFDAQMAFLKKQCDVVCPADLKDVIGKRRGRFAVVTFDDGYRDNYEHAFPILRSRGLAGVFFVTTGFLDRPCLSWWDEIAWMVRSSSRKALPGGRWFKCEVPLDEPRRERAVRTLLRKYKDIPGCQTRDYLGYVADATGSGRYRGGHARDMWMTWDMVRTMRRAGMVIGGHTVNHPVLARLPREQQKQEIAGCKRRIEGEIGEPLGCFSYPVGGPRAFCDDTRECLREAGIPMAFSYYGGYRRFTDAWDWYDIPRVAVETGLTNGEFRAFVSLPQAFARHTR